MKAELLVDLTKYDKLYEKGIVGYTDMVPFRHPHIAWQNCYTLRYKNHKLAVGEDGLKFLGADDDPKEQAIDTENYAAFTAKKLQIIEEIEKPGTVLCIKSSWKGKQLVVGQWFIYRKAGNKYSRQVLSVNGADTIPFADTVWEFVQEEHLPHILYTKATKRFPGKITAQNSKNVFTKVLHKWQEDNIEPEISTILDTFF